MLLSCAPPGAPSVIKVKLTDTSHPTQVTCGNSEVIKLHSESVIKIEVEAEIRAGKLVPVNAFFSAHLVPEAAGRGKRRRRCGAGTSVAPEAIAGSPPRRTRASSGESRVRRRPGTSRGITAPLRQPSRRLPRPGDSVEVDGCGFSAQHRGEPGQHVFGRDTDQLSQQRRGRLLALLAERVNPRRFCRACCP